MASTLETYAKLMGTKAVIGGGIEKINKIISGDARIERRMKKRKQKERAAKDRLILDEEYAEHKQWLRDEGSLIQAIKDRAYGHFFHLNEEEQMAKDMAEAEKDVLKQKKLEYKWARNERISQMSTSEWAEERAYKDNLIISAEKAKEAEVIHRDTGMRLSAMADKLMLDSEGKELGNNNNL